MFYFPLVPCSTNTVLPFHCSHFLMQLWFQGFYRVQWLRCVVLLCCSCCAGRGRQCQPWVHSIVRAQSRAGAFQSKGWVWFSKPPKSFKMIITGTGRNETLKRWVPLVWKLVLVQNSPSAVYPGFKQVNLCLKRWQLQRVQCWGDRRE